MTEEGYQPIKTKKTIKIIPPNTSSNVQKKDGYTWEDLDKAWWEGFDNAKNKMEKRITDLEKENAELKEQNRKLLESCEGATMMYEHLTNAKEIIKKLVLEVKGYEEINGYDTCEPVQEAEQFLSEVEK